MIKKLNTYLKTYKTAIKYVITGLAVLILGTIYCISVLADREKETAQYYNNQTTEEETMSFDSEEEKISANENKNEDIYVYICGCVNNPGVYQCVQGMRVYEAIDMAGGFTEDACTEALNLAELVKDKEKIYVPDVQTASNSENISDNTSGRININTATIEELMTLPGIGEAKAKDIIAYRTQNGSFTATEDIMKISGIKEAAYAKIRDYITI